MRRVSIICKCGELADVVDKTIMPHGSCDRSGARYVPSPRHSSPSTSPDENPIELIAEADLPCPVCETHSVGTVSLYRETLPHKVSNATAKGEYPEWSGPISSTVD